jgi:hypothetical protein
MSLFGKNKSKFFEVFGGNFCVKNGKSLMIVKIGEIEEFLLIKIDMTNF